MKRKNLKLFRVEHDLTQEQMAKISGVCKATYNFIEIGKRQGSALFWKSLQENFNIPDEQMYRLMKTE